MIVEDLLKLLEQSQWVEIAGDYSGDSPSYAGTIKGLIGESKYEFFCAQKVNGLFTESEDEISFLIIYYDDSELEGGAQ